MGKKKGGYPKPGICEQCGRPIMRTWNTHRFCGECAAERAALSNQINRQRYEEKRKATRAMEGITKIDKSRDWEDHICRVTDKCKYGLREGKSGFCNYFCATKYRSLRTIEGKHLIKNGKCDLFEEGEPVNSNK